jgi:hypothetical protein
MPIPVTSGATARIGPYSFAMSGDMTVSRSTVFEETLPAAMIATITGAGVVNTDDWDYPITITGLNYQNGTLPDTTTAVTGLANALVKFLYTHTTLGEIVICGTLISPTVSGSNVTGTLRVKNYATTTPIFGHGVGNAIASSVAGIAIAGSTPGVLAAHVVMNGSEALVGKVLAMGLSAELPTSISLVWTNGTSNIHSASQQALAGTTANFGLAHVVNLNNRLTRMASNLAAGFNDPQTNLYHVAVCNLSSARNNRVRVVLGMSD